MSDVAEINKLVQKRIELKKEIAKIIYLKLSALKRFK